MTQKFLYKLTISLLELCKILIESNYHNLVITIFILSFKWNKNNVIEIDQREIYYCIVISCITIFIWFYLNEINTAAAEMSQKVNMINFRIILNIIL